MTSAPKDTPPAPGEFEQIAQRFLPLTFGRPEALGLLDDAALIPSRPGYDLVITADALVEGVHFLPGTSGDRVAHKLLGTNLSDLAAKGAEPYGCFLTICWPVHYDQTERDRFATALGEGLAACGMALFGGDTTATAGPLTASLTAMGWVPAGGMMRRSGARVGDRVMVTGTIGDGYLGLLAARGALLDLGGGDRAALQARYERPQPRLALRQALRGHATACADVSDGLAADAGHIGLASRVGIQIDLARVPLSGAALAWIALQRDEAQARSALITGGDDYELVCTASPDRAAAFIGAARDAGLALSDIGCVVEGDGVRVDWQGRRMALTQAGYRHP